MAYLRALANGHFRADVRMKGIVKNKTFNSLVIARAWADKIEYSIKTLPNLNQSQLMALSEAEIDSMGGDELFKLLGIDLFAIRNQVQLETINNLRASLKIQPFPRHLTRSKVAEMR